MRAAFRLLSFRGRIPRSTFWGESLALCLAFVVLYVFLKEEFGATSTLILYPFLLWIGAALAVKRLHDRGRSAWALAVALIPIAGPLWLAVELGFRRGTLGDNQHGPDPLARNADYLAVDIRRV